MTMIRRRPRPLPPSVRAYPEVPWVEPTELAPPLWRRVLSVVELGLLIVVLGVALTIAVGIVLLATFFLLDYLIS